MTQVELGAAYIKSVSSDGEGGFNVSYVLDGGETRVHFAADEWEPANLAFVDSTEDAVMSIWSWTDSFVDSDRTDGSSYFDYFDLHGWFADLPGEQRPGLLRIWRTNHAR